MDVDVRNLPEGITILTGGRGAGKTRACQRWAAQVKELGWSLGGLVCPAVFEGGVKTGIDMFELKTGIQARLAASVKRNTGYEVTDHWDFDSTVMARGSEILSNAGHCDLFIVDELGPLEFNLKRGWIQAFETLTKGEFKRAVVVIRPELMAEALQLWPDANIVEINS